MKINQILLIPWILSGIYVIMLTGGSHPAAGSLSPSNEGYLILGLLTFFIAYTVFLACLFRDELRAAFHIKTTHRK